MDVVFTTRNLTENGCPSTANATRNRAAAEKKAVELMEMYPGIVFEVVELVAKTRVETQILPGRGRAGNGYKARVARTFWYEK